jgi:dipeptidase E
MLLASRGIPDLVALAGVGRRQRALLVVDAADPLDDPGIVAEVEDELRRAGLEVVRMRLAASTLDQVRSAVSRAEIIAVSGGDPFHLLSVARQASFGDAVGRGLKAGAVYVGYSAGAMVVAPTLEPLAMTSPFTAPAELDLAGLGLVDVLVLPHDDHAGRAERHRAAEAAFGHRLRLIRLRDGDVLLHDDGRESVLRRGGASRRSPGRADVNAS